MSGLAKKIFPVFFLIIIILLNLVVYWPALLHPARSDQNFFLIETLDDSALTPLIGRRENLGVHVGHQKQDKDHQDRVFMDETGNP